MVKTWETVSLPYGAVGQSYQRSNDATAVANWKAPDVGTEAVFAPIILVMLIVLSKVEGVVVYDVYETHVANASNSKTVYYPACQAFATQLSGLSIGSILVHLRSFS